MNTTTATKPPSQQELDAAREAWERANVKLAKVDARAILSRQQADQDDADRVHAQDDADNRRSEYEDLVQRFVRRDRGDQVAQGLQHVRDRIGAAVEKSAVVENSTIDDMDGDTKFLVDIEARIAADNAEDRQSKIRREEVACMQRLVTERPGSGYALRAQAILDMLPPGALTSGADAPAAQEAAG